MREGDDGRGGQTLNKKREKEIDMHSQYHMNITENLLVHGQREIGAASEAIHESLA